MPSFDSRYKPCLCVRKKIAVTVQVAQGVVINHLKQTGLATLVTRYIFCTNPGKYTMVKDSNRSSALLCSGSLVSALMKKGATDVTGHVPAQILVVTDCSHLQLPCLIEETLPWLSSRQSIVTCCHVSHFPLVIRTIDNGKVKVGTVRRYGSSQR